jgi:hydroxyethylthiazole kinase-like uncharacterized protein yjeF
MKDLTQDSIRAILRPRLESSHKGDYGHAFLIAGNIGKMGSAVIASKACLRSGCGLLTVSVPQDEQLILQTTIPEAMLTIRENDEDNFKKFSAAGIGPGIGTTKESIQILTYLLREFKKPIVIDADALNILAMDRKRLDLIPPNTILTPHPLEFDRLFGDQGSIELRMTSAMDNAKEYNITIVLKGHRTFITNGTESYLSSTGNAGLAKAGSGDALTGMITSFLAQGYSAFDAAIMSVHLHGLAADIAMTEQSMESMLITDVIACFGKAFKEVLK